jgi:hypothetical protein
MNEYRKNRTLYCNNSGSRWVAFDAMGRREQRDWLTRSGSTITRRVRYYACGNYPVACIRYKGRLLRVLLDAVLED